MARYSHQFLVAFTIISDAEDTETLSKELLLAGLLRRAQDIDADEAGIEAFQLNDTEEI